MKNLKNIYVYHTVIFTLYWTTSILMIWFENLLNHFFSKLTPMTSGGEYIKPLEKFAPSKENIAVWEIMHPTLDRWMLF